MFLIYADIITPRLQYVASFIFGEQYHQSVRFTSDERVFGEFEGYRIRYSTQAVSGNWFLIPAAGLVFEEGIRPLDIQVSEWEGCPAFFFAGEGSVPFDIFSATFFFLSRYEEYWPYEPDEYGRYPHAQSVAYKYDFLHLPVINIWLTLFANALKSFFPGLELPRPVSQVKPTYDIDIAWSYRHKGFLRNLGGFIRRPSIERWRVLLGLSKDPFDCYDFLDQVHDRFASQPIYFFLLAANRSRYDKNIDPMHPAMQRLLGHHARKYETGIHPSWASFNQDRLLASEIQTLSHVTGKPVTASRQHYIHFHLPGTFRQLIRAGITDEYSMGYGSINGFRASVASSFYWYDLEKEELTGLRLHPFCFMDANAHYEQKQDVNKSVEELNHYLSICRKHHGTLITIFHNQFLGNDPDFRGWPGLYEEFISQVPR